MGRLALGGLVAGGGFIASPALAGAENVSVVDDSDDSNNDIETGNDPDHVDIVGNDDYTATTNDGADIVDISGDGDNTIHPGDDPDAVEIEGDGDNTITDVDGDTTVDIIGNGDNAIDTGDDADEVFITGDGDNTINTGDAADIVDISGNGDNAIDTGNGEDNVSIDGNGDNTVNTGNGDDEVSVFGQGDNTIDGGGGNDSIEFGPAGRNTAHGGEGDDSIVGAFHGEDVIDGESGDDHIEGGFLIFMPGVEAKEDTGDDVLSGGTGSDVIFGDSAEAGRVCAPFDPDSTTTLALICGDDLITGDSGTDWLEGNLGADDISGGADNDVVIGDDLYHHLGNLGQADLDALIEDVRSGLLGAPTPYTVFSLTTTSKYFGITEPGGNDVVDGGDGADVVAGMGGNDVVCGDADDLAVFGGGGTDVPCVTSEETVDASSGSATGDLSSTVRELDDEDFEVDEAGNHNPYEFVIDAELVSSDGDIDTYKTAKGTVELNRMTGEYTYTADPGATGTEDIAFTVRRTIVAGCADYSNLEILDEVGNPLPSLYEPGCAPPPPFARRAAVTALTPEIVDDGGTEWLYSLWEALAIFISDPPVDVVPPPAEPPTDPIPDPIPDTIVDPVVAVQATDATPAELPRTGSDATDLALAGLALLALGGAATIESRRRLARAN